MTIEGSSLENDLETLRALVRAGRLFDVQAWIAAGKPLFAKEGRRSDALAIAIGSGFHSMVDVLAASWPDRESLNAALQQAADMRRADLVWLLLEHGADMRVVFLWSVAGCYDWELMKYFLDQWDVVGTETGLTEIVTARVYPLIGLIRDYAPRIPNHEVQLSTALNEFVEEGRLKWVSLALWMGADPRLPAPTRYTSDYPEEWITPMESAISQGSLAVLKLMKPSKERDNLNQLLAKLILWKEGDIEIAEYLLRLGADINNKPSGGASLLDRLLSPCLRSWTYRSFGVEDISTLEAWVGRGARLVLDYPSQIRDIRTCIYGFSTENIKRIMAALSRATDQELLLKVFSTPKLLGQLGLKASGLREYVDNLYNPKEPEPRITPVFFMPSQTSFLQVKPRITTAKTTVLSREALYQRIWSKPGPALAAELGIWPSDLEKLCKEHRIPMPQLGFWATKGERRAASQMALDEPDWNPTIDIKSWGSAPPIKDKESRLQVEAIIEQLSAPGLTVEVPADLRPLHWLLGGDSGEKPTAVQRAWIPPFTLPDSDSALRSTDKGVLEAYHERAPRVTNALFLFLESQGFTLKPEHDGYGRGIVDAVMFGQEVPFCIRREGIALRLNVFGCPYQVPSSWRDGQRRVLESCCAQVASSLAYTAALKG